MRSTIAIIRATCRGISEIPPPKKISGVCARRLLRQHDASGRKLAKGGLIPG